MRQVGVAHPFQIHPESRLPHPCRALCDRVGILTLRSERIASGKLRAMPYTRLISMLSASGQTKNTR